MNNLLILGATSDIARSTAEEFARRGWKLTLAGRKRSDLEIMADDISQRHNIECEVAEFDGRNLTSHSDFYKNLATRPDVTLLAFGVMGTPSQKDELLETNFTGPVSILSIIADDMEEKGKGGLIVISSVAGDRGKARNNYYTSAKAGLTAFTTGLRQRLHPKGIHVMTVKPGFVRTKMTAGHQLNRFLITNPEVAGRAIYRAFARKQNVLYITGRWRLVMFIVKHIPEFIYKRIKI